MDITPLIPKGKLVLNRYGGGGFVVNEVAYKGNILLSGERVLPWNATSLADAATESFADILAGEAPEIMLIGAGHRFLPMPPSLKRFFRERAIACDAMDTGAACRTFSVLIAEGRSVAAALIAV